MDELRLNAAMLQVEPQQHIQLSFRMLQLQSLQHTYMVALSADCPPADSLSFGARTEQAGFVLGWLADSSAHLLLFCDNPVVCQHQQRPGSCACRTRKGGRGVAGKQGVAKHLCLPPCARLSSSCAQQHAGLTTAGADKPGSRHMSAHQTAQGQLLSLTAPDGQPLWQRTQRQLPMQLC